jgi:hypothetical protein
LPAAIVAIFVQHGLELIRLAFGFIELSSQFTADAHKPISFLFEPVYLISAEIQFPLQIEDSSFLCDYLLLEKELGFLVRFLDLWALSSFK